MHLPVVVLLGPTGVGKTALAVEMAPNLGGEIVSADSRQIYRYMDIGTAKPTPTERAAVPHHMIDLVDPDQPLSLAEYCDQARAALQDISRRARLPFLVGGTGQYLAALLQGWKIPRVPPQTDLRERLRQQAQREGVHSLYERLQEIDPPAAANILPNNLRRIIRALEVFEVSGRPFSEQRGRETPPYDFLILGLTMERPALYERVDHRAERMVQQGLVHEVHSLLQRGYEWDLPAMSGLGYAQFRPCLEGRCSLEEALTRLKYDTHAFIRHQYTWFRRFSVQRWFDMSQADEQKAVKAHVQEWLESTDKPSESMEE
ncbi:MAG: tRNA (adenosine(37)-N6)-dimethylallyltransferase MiaA [Chloroflexia bacterium]|nr:tRNA (adenosine(37)-N6)-dimethylallyltransferase MiaA [Chloroflexia bacterium]